MKYYLLKPRVLWGDYGRILLHGILRLHSKRHVAEELPVLDGCCPFEPIILPGLSFVCSDLIRNKLEKGNSGLAFVPCSYGHIAKLDWRSWPNSEKPKFWPKGSEPENYIYESPSVELHEKYFLLQIKSVAQLWEPKADDIKQVAMFAMSGVVRVLSPPLGSDIFVGRYGTSNYNSAIFVSENFVKIIGRDLGNAVALEDFEISENTS